MILANWIAPYRKFLQLGKTNDLAPYLLPAEQGNIMLTAFADTLHPPVLNVCQQVAEVVAKLVDLR